MLEPFIKIKNITGHLGHIITIYYEAKLNNKKYSGIRHVFKNINTLNLKQEIIIIDLIPSLTQRIISINNISDFKTLITQKMVVNKD